MHILQPFCIAVFLSLFRHNKTPKVFCLTFGGHVNPDWSSFFSKMEDLDAFQNSYFNVFVKSSIIIVFFLNAEFHRGRFQFQDLTLH